MGACTYTYVYMLPCVTWYQWVLQLIKVLDIVEAPCCVAPERKKFFLSNSRNRCNTLNQDILTRGSSSADNCCQLMKTHGIETSWFSVLHLLCELLKMLLTLLDYSVLHYLHLHMQVKSSRNEWRRGGEGRGRVAKTARRGHLGVARAGAERWWGGGNLVSVST